MVFLWGERTVLWWALKLLQLKGQQQQGLCQTSAVLGLTDKNICLWNVKFRSAVKHVNVTIQQGREACPLPYILSPGFKIFLQPCWSAGKEVEIFCWIRVCMWKVELYYEYGGSEFKIQRKSQENPFVTVMLLSHKACFAKKQWVWCSSQRANPMTRSPRFSLYLLECVATWDPSE